MHNNVRNLVNQIAIWQLTPIVAQFYKSGNSLFWSRFTQNYQRVNMSTTMEIKKAMLSTNKSLVDENNLEIPSNSIIHCLGSLFQISDTGLRHIVGKKIDNDTYFADSYLYIQLNELAFVE